MQKEQKVHVYYVEVDDGGGVRTNKCSPYFSTAKARDDYMEWKGMVVYDGSYNSYHPADSYIIIPAIYDDVRDVKMVEIEKKLVSLELLFEPNEIPLAIEYLKTKQR